MHEEKNGTFIYQRCATFRDICLDLHLLETVLPDNDVGGDTILTVVEEDNTRKRMLASADLGFGGECEDVQAIGVHGLASVELKVLEVGQELLLDVALSTLLESRDGVGIGTLLLELGLDSLEVAYLRNWLAPLFFWVLGELGMGEKSSRNSPLR